MSVKRHNEDIGTQTEETQPSPKKTKPGSSENVSDPLPCLGLPPPQPIPFSRYKISVESKEGIKCTTEYNALIVQIKDLNDQKKQLCATIENLKWKQESIKEDMESLRWKEYVLTNAEPGIWYHVPMQYWSPELSAKFVKHRTDTRLKLDCDRDSKHKWDVNDIDWGKLPSMVDDDKTSSQLWPWLDTYPAMLDKHLIVIKEEDGVEAFATINIPSYVIQLRSTT